MHKEISNINTKPQLVSRSWLSLFPETSGYLSSLYLGFILSKALPFTVIKWSFGVLWWKVVLTVPSLLLPSVIILFRLLSKAYGESIALGDTHVRWRSGSFFTKKKQLELRYTSILFVGLTQSFWERILNIGTVSFVRRSQGAPEITFRGVFAPQKLIAQVKAQMV